MMNDNHNRTELAIQVARAYEYEKWDALIPYIQWPTEWMVKARPPMMFAVIRYDIMEITTHNTISIYLDCYDMLGSISGYTEPQPYWEIYPAEGGDTERYAMSDIEGLLNGLHRSFDWRRIHSIT